MTAGPVAAGPSGLGSAVPVDEAPDRLPALDGYRAVAAFMVLATHVGFQTGASLRGPFAPLLSRLDAGVTVFFLLSGFLLYLPFTRAHQTGRTHPRVHAYLWRRALRVLPAYWAALLGAALLLPELAGTSATEWLRQALLLQTFTQGHLLAGLTQMWSLAVEVSFYLALPLLALAARRVPLRGATPLRRELTVLAGMAVVGLAWTVLAHTGASPNRAVAPLWLPGYLDWFALGMAAAVLRVHLGLGRGGPATALRDLAAAPGTCLVVGGLLFWLATTPLAGPRDLEAMTPWEALSRHLLYGLAGAAVLLPAVFATRRGPVETVLTHPVVAWLGEVSYGVFLWHVLLLSVVFRATGLEQFSGGGLVVASALLPVSVGAAAASLYLLERPVMRLRGLVGPGPRPPRAAPAPAATPPG